MGCRHLICAAGLAALLAGCGETVADRTLGGAGVGAAAGAAGAAVVGGSVATGLAAGAAVGAVTGAVTDSDDINLGRPWWKRLW